MSDDNPANKVGRGRPPVEARFQKGRSGNPKGRPKGSKNVVKVVELELDGKVTVIENGQRRRLSRVDVMVKALVAKAMKGDLRAFEAITKLLPERFREPPAEANSTQPLNDYEAEVLERFIARRIAKEGSSRE